MSEKESGKSGKRKKTPTARISAPLSSVLLVSDAGYKRTRNKAGEEDKVQYELWSSTGKRIT